jgi:hypothetical protein
MMNVRAALSVIACLPLYLPALADAQQIHKWTDVNGQVHYSDQPPARQESTVVGEISRPLPPPGQASAVVDRNVPASGTDGLPRHLVPGTPEYDAEVAALNAAVLKKRSFQLFEDSPPSPTPEDPRRAMARQCEKYALEMKKREQAIINACKARRETYCNRGSKEIAVAETLNGIRFRESTDAARARALERGESPPPVRLGYVTPPETPVAPAGCEGYIRKR